METNRLSTSSIGEEKFNEGATSVKSESGESNIPCVQIYDESGRRIEVSQGSSIPDQKKSLKEQKNRSFVSTIGKDSASNSSFTVGDETLKTSESMLSFTSTTAICGSSSSDIASSEEEPFGDLEGISKKRESSSIDSIQSNNLQYEETGNKGRRMGSRSKDQSERLKVQEKRTSTSTIVKDSESNIPLRVENQNMKKSKSMLSFTSTTAIRGSSSSDIASSEEEPFGDLEGISKKRESGNIDSIQSNNQQYEETDNAGLTMGSRRKDQSERLKVQEKRTSTCTIVKDSENNISLRVDNKNLKTSESMLSFNSTAGTCGSSSPDDTSSEEEQLDDFEDISEKRETKRGFNLENPILEFTPRAVKNISNSPSAISFSVTRFSDETQTNLEFTSTKGSLLQEDSSSLKSKDMNCSLDEDILQSLPSERLSRLIKAAFPMQKSLSSTLNCFSDIEDLSSNNNPIDVPPLVRIAPSLNTREVETSDISYCDSTHGVADYESNRENYCQKEDESVRAFPSLSELVYGALAPSIPGSSMKFEPSLLQVPTLLQQTLAPSIPGSSIKIEPSVLQVPKSLQHTSPEEGDWDIYENCGRSSGEKCSVQKPCVEDMISSWQEIANTDAARGVETESLLEEVHNFFENNCAEANTRSKENKDRTATKDFSDVLPQRSTLHSHEKLIQECLMNLEHYTSLNPRTEVEFELELLEKCKMLIEFSIPEDSFIGFAESQILMVSGRECDLESIGESCDKEPQDYFSGLRFSIMEDFNFFVIVKLYKKLKYEGATFLSILDESKEPTADEERFRCRELLSKAQNSHPTLDDKCFVYIDRPPLNRRHTQNVTDTGCPLGGGDDSAIGSFKQHSQESNNDKSSDVVSVSDSSELDSSVLAENEISNEKTFLTLT